MSSPPPPEWLEQYRTLTEHAGYLHLAEWSSVTLTGGDRTTFLHNLCTNDVRRLEAGAGCETFVTNVQGKTLGHGWVTVRKEEIVLIGSPGQGEPLVAHLDRYLIREDVQLADTTAVRAYFLLAGAESGGALQALFGEGPWVGQGVPRPGTSFAVRLNGATLKLVAIDLLGPRVPAWLLEAPTAEAGASQDIGAALQQAGAAECDEAAFTAARIEAGTPLYGVDFDSHCLPQELARDDRAISFTKGCYLGQETVARIDALGHVNRRLVGVQFPAAAAPATGLELSHGDRGVGQATSVAWSPRLDAPLALAIIRRECTAAGTELDSPAGSCQVVALPVEG